MRNKKIFNEICDVIIRIDEHKFSIVTFSIKKNLQI